MWFKLSVLIILIHLLPLPCGACSSVPREGFDSNVIMLCLFLVCCGCDTSYIVSVHIQCQASLYTRSLCRGHSWRVRLAKQKTLPPHGHLVSPLGSVNVHRGALLLVPQWQCISSLVFYIIHTRTQIQAIFFTLVRTLQRRWFQWINAAFRRLIRWRCP